jgi:hypothetical protein
MIKTHAGVVAGAGGGTLDIQDADGQGILDADGQQMQSEP